MSDCRIPVHGFACIPCERSCNAEQKTDCRNEAERHCGTEHIDELQFVFEYEHGDETEYGDETEHIDKLQFVFQLW